MKLVKWLIGVCVIFVILFGIYEVFINCEKVNSHFGNIITLQKMDQANIEDEAFIKLIGIDDNRCKDDSCEREGELVAKLIVLNNHRISYVKLGTLAETTAELDKMDYKIELLDIENEEVKVKLTKIEK